ncbi:MAG: hypothetical protein M1816_002215 [Peltula sp. TS41687]|nr:MAG: hypothetical protein M1816_002215 [Peltula sp. TS41687]
MAESTPKSYSTDPTLYLYTSLTAGSSHIITATSRLETILKSNRIPFQALDVATDEKARMLWGRRAGKRKLPGLVRMGMIVGDLEQIEEWNEYGELKEQLGNAPLAFGTPSSSANPTPNNTPSRPQISFAQADKPKVGTESSSSPLTDAMRKAGEEAARVAGEKKSKAGNALSQDEGVDTATSSVDKSLSQAAVVPPPSGTADSGSATDSPLQAGGSRATEVASPITFSPDHHLGHTTTHRGSNVSTASAELIRDIERALVIPEEPEAEAESEDKDNGQAVIERDPEDEPSHPGTSEPTTQDQPATSGGLAGASVKD